MLQKRGFIATSAVILGMLAAPFILFLFANSIPSVVPRELCEGGAPNCTNRLYLGLDWLAIATTSMFFGAIGIVLSYVLRRRTDGDLFDIDKKGAVVLLYATGSVLALLMLAAFMGGLVQGALFPDFKEIKRFSGINSFGTADWGKLAIWSFLAGFSERLIPNLFDSLAGKFADDSGTKASQPSKNLGALGADEKPSALPAAPPSV
ncbi:MAG: hypothetical protein U1E56_09525 [Bauldia sp.]